MGGSFPDSPEFQSRGASPLGAHRQPPHTSDRPQGEPSTTATYKPGPQAKYLVDKMQETETALIASITKLMEKLDSLEKKVDSLGGDLGQVQTKVNMAMMSVGLVQQEQVQVLKQLKSMAGSTSPHPEEGVIGASPSTIPTESTSPSKVMHTVIPPQFTIDLQYVPNP